MKTTPKQDEPAKPADASADRGVPPTHAWHAVRKDLTVRVTLGASAVAEGDELREHGYGHGV